MMSGDGPSEVQVLNIIGRAQSMIARLEVMGVNTSPARSLLDDARGSLKGGDNTVALEYAKQSITEIVRLKKMSDKGASPGPAPAGGPAPAPAQSAPAAAPRAMPVASTAAGSATSAGGGGGDVPSLKDGYSYVFEEDTPRKCFTTLKNLMDKGHKAYCITRRNPRMVCTEFGLDDAKMIWLTESSPEGIDTMEPSLESILWHMEAFVDENERPVLLLDGIEYLASKTSFDAVMSFVRRLVDMVSDKGVIFMTVVSPEALGEKATKSLEREVTVV